MQYTQEFGELVHKAEIAPGVFDYTISSPAIATAASAGQFVNLICDGYSLRRPISLCGFDAQAGTVRLVFEIRGKGTDWLAHCKLGDKLDMAGPLGHGFLLDDKSKKVVMVGGGIGTPPLLPIAQALGKNTTVISGFRTAGSAILQKDFEAVGAHTILCTDDGSAGFHGFTTQALEKHLKTQSCDAIYTCGPKIMMHGVAQIAEAHDIPCYVSMEERMACGVGACLGCTCQTHDDKGTHMKRVCVDGPVFLSSEVDWDV